MSNNDNKTLVTENISKQLKQLGFNWKTLYYYDADGKLTYGNFYSDWNKKEDYSSAPSLDEVSQWLRETKEADVNVLTDFDSEKRFYYVRYVIKDGHFKTYHLTENQSFVYFNTYEDALEAGIIKVLTILTED